MKLQNSDCSYLYSLIFIFLLQCKIQQLKFIVYYLRYVNKKNLCVFNFMLLLKKKKIKSRNVAISFSLLSKIEFIISPIEVST